MLDQKKLAFAVEQVPVDGRQEVEFLGSTYVINYVRHDGLGFGFVLDSAKRRYLIVLDSDLNEAERRSILLHEMAELHLMHRHGWPQPRAHLAACNAELKWREQACLEVPGRCKAAKEQR